MRSKTIFMAILFVLLSMSIFGADFTVEYKCKITNPTTNQMNGEIRVTNNSGSDIALEDLSINYYYTKEGSASENGYCDWADVSGSTYRNIIANVYYTFEEGQFNIRFTSAAGILKAGDVVKAQYRIAKSDWSNYDQTNDSSFNPELTTLTPVTTITVNGTGAGNEITVSGQVNNSNGFPFEGAVVSVGEDQAVTDAEGEFSFTATVSGEEVVVNVTGADCAEYSKPIEILNNSVMLYAELLNVDKKVTFNPSTTKTITTADGASVTFPGMSGISENLIVSVTSISAANADIQSAPGDFSAITNAGDEVVLLSQGMIDVQITGATSGDSYSLEGKGPFTIKIPPSFPETAPPSMALWYYDTDLGKWIEEGVALLANGVYEGTVTHFTTYNVDEPADELTCVMVDYNDPSNPLGVAMNYKVTISTEGWSDTFSGQTTPDCSFINVPAGFDTFITVTNLDTGYVGSANTLIPLGNNGCMQFPDVDLHGGAIAGMVKDACSGSPLPGIEVELYNSGGTLVGTAVTDGDGYYVIDVDPGTGYYAVFDNNDYQQVTYYNITLVGNTTKTIDQVLQIEDGNGIGDISGVVKDAQDGSIIPNASLVIREGLNVTSGTAYASLTADANGEYSLSDVPQGNYTIEASANGYVTGYETVISVSCLTGDDQDINLFPLTDEFSIVLTWGATPSDLDSHLTGPLASGGRFHIYYSDRTEPGVAELDLDDTSSFGPETITILEQIEGTYRYSVFDYSNQSVSNNMALAQSGATVKVYNSGMLIETFNIPPTQAGTLWTVFELIDGQIFPVNELTSGASSTTINSVATISADPFSSGIVAPSLRAKPIGNKPAIETDMSLIMALPKK